VINALENRGVAETQRTRREKPLMTKAYRFLILLVTSLVLFGLILLRSTKSANLERPFESVSIKFHIFSKTVYRDQSQHLEGCVSCHGQIEPMHKYGTTETLTQLKDGKDAVGLTCTACHGGNPVPTKKGDAPKI